ncbi:putative Ring finger and CHY zinc finger domain-containing protein, plant [Helianthus annuus]|uniref:Ring finger and CHY zinc finger domain-containing protein, plant n=1 Tax=Helianthus annuus TaxID=4232 RepID=A0A9K3JWK0_HELAN|nr:putative Ring finger and CHY zinc finger domain-containing protein, plant [Helianthus annuus]KAJ0627763.1 putative Zinc finger, RING/FYVE/PHD-type, Zinc finger, C3HC4 RING-type [Helianthus annuus]KAJ0949036.1 putative Ring finger and CHY zinc finger domain-containing protein, plant [Helianthus annuus]
MNECFKMGKKRRRVRKVPLRFLQRKQAFLFDTIKATTIMVCGHAIHLDCYMKLIDQEQYQCPMLKIGV